MEKEDNELLLEQILSIIEENNKKIESQDSEELLKQMVWEGLLFLESKAGTMSNELTELYKTYKEYLKLSDEEKQMLRDIGYELQEDKKKKYKSKFQKFNEVSNFEKLNNNITKIVTISKDLNNTIERSGYGHGK